MAPKKPAVSRSSEVLCGEGEPSTSRGSRGPIVVRENLLGKSRATVDPQDASLVETHLVSRTAKGWEEIWISGCIEWPGLYDTLVLIFTLSLKCRLIVTVYIILMQHL